MNIVELCRAFPTELSCIKHLERVRWKDGPICPYCNSRRSTPAPKEYRHHCNSCNTSFRVTTKTIFHRSHLPLQKWFLAICLVLNAKKGISARQLSRDLKINKDTAWYMAMRIRQAMREQKELLSGIVEVDETYIGGKPSPTGPTQKRGRGTSKFPVVGMAERKGKIRAKTVSNVSSKTLSSLVRGNINLDQSTIITDQFLGYAPLSSFADHKTVNHSIWYVDGDKHTNNIESFWALLKRGIVGQYHKVSVTHLPKYIDEFCFRHNNRRNLELFNLTIAKAIGAC